MAKTNRFLHGDGEEVQAVNATVDEDRYFDPGYPAKQNAYRAKIRKELMAARYREWLRAKRQEPQS